MDSTIVLGRLARLFPGARLPPLSLYAAWPGRIDPPARTRTLIALAKARLAVRGRAGGR